MTDQTRHFAAVVLRVRPAWGQHHLLIFPLPLWVHGNRDVSKCVAFSVPSPRLDIVYVLNKSCRTREIKLKIKKLRIPQGSFLCVLVGHFFVVMNSSENNLSEEKIGCDSQHHVACSSSWRICGGTDHFDKKDNVQQSLSLHSVWGLKTDRKGTGTRFP